MTLGQRIAATSVAVSLLLLLLGVQVFDATRAEREAARWVEHTHAVLQQISLVGFQSLSVPRAAGNDALFESLTTLGHLTEDNPTQQENVAMLERAARTGNPPFQLVLARMSDEEGRLLHDRVQHAQLLSRRALRLVFLLVVLGAGTGVATGIYVIRSLGEPLRRMARAASAFADGREALLSSYDLQRRDELGEVARSLERLMRRRSETEASLRRVMMQFEAVFEGSPLAMIAVDTEDRVTAWNHAAELLFGWARHEVLGRPVPIIPEEDRSSREALRSRVRTLRASDRVESRRRRRDGTLVDVRMHVAPLYVESEQEAGYLVLYEDLGPYLRQQAAREAALASARELSQALERLAHGAVEIADEVLGHGRTLPELCPAIARTAARITRARYAAVGIGTDPDRPFSPWGFHGMPEDLASRMGRLPRAVGVLGWVARRGQVARVEKLSEHPAYRGLPEGHPPMDAFLGVPIRYEGRNVGNLYLARGPGEPAFTELDQRAMELLSAHAGVAIENARLYEAIRRDERRQRALVEASAPVAESLDPADAAWALAKAAVPAFGAVCVLELIDQEACALRRTAFSTTLPALAREFSQALGHEVPLSSADGRARVVRTRHSLRVSLQDPAHGTAEEEVRERLSMRGLGSMLTVPLVIRERVLGVLTVASEDPGRYDERDLSFVEELGRRAALALENARLYEEARTAVRAREDLLAIVSHDLRSPLAALKLHGARLRMLGDALPPPARESVARMEKLSTRMGLLVNDLLDSAALEAGRLGIRPQKLELAGWLSQVNGLLEDLLAPRRQKLVLELEPELPPVRGDADRLLQVLTNLVGNAAKFTPEEGRITVRARRRGQQVEVEVADTGVGIAPDALPRLFERFWQAPGTRARGSGLGLYIVRGLVQAHGGEVSASSAPGRGTTIRFTIPAWDERPPATEETRPLLFH